MRPRGVLPNGEAKTFGLFFSLILCVCVWGGRQSHGAQVCSELTM